MSLNLKLFIVFCCFPFYYTSTWIVQELVTSVWWRWFSFFFFFKCKGSLPASLTVTKNKGKRENKFGSVVWACSVDSRSNWGRDIYAHLRNSNAVPNSKVNMALHGCAGRLLSQKVNCLSATLLNFIKFNILSTRCWCCRPKFIIYYELCVSCHIGISVEFC